MRARLALPAIAMLLALIITSAVPAPATAGAAGPRPIYLSLGTSLSVGIQPDSDGQNRPTHKGYADQLHAALLSTTPTLKLHKLGCPGETSVTMIVGGICSYDEGSQLAAAVSFLGAHRRSVVLVTIDMGANDIEGCGSLVAGIDQACVTKAFADVAAHLPYILATLRAATSPDVPIVAMNYYNPFVAAWLLGPAGEVLAQQSSVGLGLFNAILGGIYTAFLVPVADVAAAFHTVDFAPVPAVGNLPLNVVLVCQWTWMCAPPPVGPNIHANVLGYGVIAEAFLSVLPPLH